MTDLFNSIKGHDPLDPGRLSGGTKIILSEPNTRRNPVMHSTLNRLFGLVLLLLSIDLFQIRVKATGNYGPYTCLQGWVWRQAVPNDYVCVTVEIRSQTAQDNALAPSRVNPNGGPYGPNTCLNGYVWREAVPGDEVCVTPATRSEAAYDNSQAPNRWATLNISISTFVEPVNWPTPQRILITGDHFNFAEVNVGVYDLNNVAHWTENFTAYSNYGLVAGSFITGAPFALCDNFTALPYNGYVKVYDTLSDRWSPEVYVKTTFTQEWCP